jgi:choline dehydrogenase
MVLEAEVRDFCREGCDTFIDCKGERVSTESAYLTTDVLTQANLAVGTHIQVTKILFDTSSGENPRATGVEFVQENSGPCYRVRAAKEVIVCCGAIHFPHVS